MHVFYKSNFFIFFVYPSHLNFSRSVLLFSRRQLENVFYIILSYCNFFVIILSNVFSHIKNEFEVFVILSFTLAIRFYSLRYRLCPITMNLTNNFNFYTGHFKTYAMFYELLYVLSDLCMFLLLSCEPILKYLISYYYFYEIQMLFLMGNLYHTLYRINTHTHNPNKHIIPSVTRAHCISQNYSNTFRQLFVSPDFITCLNINFLINIQ